jgi:small ligand-binding sensory domain FIST
MLAVNGILESIETDLQTEETAASRGNSQLCFSSSLSVDIDMEASIRMAASEILQKHPADATQDLLFLSVSSVYEGAYDFEQVIPFIQKYLPNVKNIIGCTTSCVVGGETPDGFAQEIETKPTVGMALAGLPDVELRFFRATQEDLIKYGKDVMSLGSLTGMPPDPDIEKYPNPPSHGESCFMIWPTPSTIDESVLARFLYSLQQAYPFSIVVGGIAAAVSQLSNPRVFLWTSEVGGKGSVFPDGLVGIHMTGNVLVTTLEVPCMKPLGPVFEIVETDEFTIRKVIQRDPAGFVLAKYNNESIVNALAQAMTEMSREDKEKLRVDTYIGMTSQLTLEEAYDGFKYWYGNSVHYILVDTNTASRKDINKYVIQKIAAVNLGNGAVTVSMLPKNGSLLRCVADLGCRVFERCNTGFSFVTATQLCSAGDLL